MRGGWSAARHWIYYRFYDAEHEDQASFEKRIDTVVREIGDRGKHKAASVSEAIPPARGSTVRLLLGRGPRSLLPGSGPGSGAYPAPSALHDDSAVSGSGANLHADDAAMSTVQQGNANLSQAEVSTFFQAMRETLRKRGRMRRPNE